MMEQHGDIYYIYYILNKKCYSKPKIQVCLANQWTSRPKNLQLGICLDSITQLNLFYCKHEP